MRQCLCVLLFVAVGGCQTERVGSYFETSTSEGRWRTDGYLIRSYQVTLGQAADAVLALARKNRWLLIDDRRDQTGAGIVTKTHELVEISFDIWAPPDKATDIGIKYAGGNRPGSIRVFQELERRMPGKRVTVNQPR